ncbi:MAG TPA: TIGR03943 family protein [Chloroflexota bacterium]|nr:TIGR03943 family protein [Chloroflexota bacterium]
MTVRLERIRASGRIGGIDLHRSLPSFVLAGYGIFILSLFARNVMTWYINPSYVAPTTLAGAVLVGLAFGALARRPAVACHDGCCSTGDCDCETPSTRWTTHALLLFPLLLALIFPPRGLAAFSANQRGAEIAGLTPIHGSATVKRVSLSVDTRSFTLEDWVGAISADPNPRDYTGKPVVLTGMVLHNPASVPPGYIMVIRYLVTCCIADARPIGLVVKDTSHGALQDNQWVTVRGTMGAAGYQGQSLAVVEPQRIDLVKSQSPYVY